MSKLFEIELYMSLKLSTGSVDRDRGPASTGGVTPVINLGDRVFDLGFRGMLIVLCEGLFDLVSF
jgi:hypothetical protein